jgi:Zn-dependent protease
MNDDTRRPGPWDPPARPAEPRGPTPQPASIEPPLDKGQNPVVAALFTLLFAAAIWWLTQSWIVAVALIFGLIVHEYGHVLAMNRLGMGPARIYIIPLLGGLAKGQRGPRSEWDGVIVSMAGPLFGLLATIPFFAAFFLLGDREWLDGAFVIALINLINLAPAPPLDGSKALGPVLAKIHPMLELGVLLLIGAIVVVWAFNRGSYIFAVFLALALYGHLRSGIRPPSGRPLTNVESLKSVALFFGTAAACVGVAVIGPTLVFGDPVTGLLAMLSRLGLMS